MDGAAHHVLADPRLPGGGDAWQLQVEHALTTAVLETVDVGIVACDAEGRLTLFNRTARGLHGVAADASVSPTRWAEAYDLYAADGVTPLSREQVPLWRALQDGMVEDRVIVVAPPGMAPRTVRCDGRQLHDEDGHVTGAVVAMHDVSDLRAAERELREERDHALSVVTTTADGYLAVDGESRVTHWNPAAAALFGYEESEVIGREVRDLVVPEGQRAAYTEQYGGFFRTDGSSFDLTGVSMLRKDGSLLECDITAWTDGTAGHRRVHAFIRDRTEQRRTAEALAAAHEDLTRVLDAMPRAIVLTTVDRDDTGDPVDLRVEWMNAFARARSSVPYDRVQRESFRVLWPQLAESYLEAYLDAVRDGEARLLPIEWPDADRVDGSFEVTLSPLDRDRLLIDVLDVTEARSAERALRQSEDRAREAQERAGMAGWDFDLITDELRWSPLMFRMLGVDPSTTPVPGLMKGLVHPDDRDGVIVALSNAVSITEAVVFDFRLHRPDGRMTYLHGTAMADRDPAGRPTKLWGTIQDVSDVVTREEELVDAAERDPLTGLLNRRGWDTRSIRAVQRHAAGEPAAVVMLDLDHFKRLNDTLGHAAGDEVLRDCAVRWQRRLRTGDLLARIGGEEFALLLFGCDEESAEQLVDDLRGETPRPVTASAGVAALHPGESVDLALRRADDALYQAKASGRDVTIVALPQQRDLPVAEVRA